MGLPVISDGRFFMPTKQAVSRPAAPVLEEAEALARHVDELWRRRGGQPEAFAAVAMEALRARRPDRVLNGDAVIDWTLSQRALPRQFSLHSLFGEPPLTLYWGERFVIELFFWLKPDLTIHDHMFSGAFAVLQGQSLHCEYDFEPGRDFEGKLHFGVLRPKLRELLRPGDVRAIAAGPGFIHGVWHLSRPALTLLIRTHKEGETQRNYWPTGLAADFQTLKWRPLLEPILQKRLAFLRYLSRLDPAKRDTYVAELLRGCGFTEAFIYLEAYFRLAPPSARRSRVLAVALRRHGTRLAPVLRTLERQESLESVPWDSLSTPGAKLLLALHFSAVERPEADRLIRELAGCRLSAASGRWLAEIEKAGTPRPLLKRLKEAYA
jgi:hypothetical protein